MAQDRQPETLHYPPCIHQILADSSLGLFLLTNRVLVIDLSPQSLEKRWTEKGRGFCISVVFCLREEENTEKGLRGSTHVPPIWNAGWRRGFKSNPLPFRTLTQTYCTSR